jgi:LPPG:FO 2-phospho-L-lactate transferase
VKIVALAGGVGGAKLAAGLAGALNPEELTVIGNTGDDFEHLGLKISPDLDTILYALAGEENPETGWGRKDESWNTHVELAFLGGESWFRLGDKDLAVHLFRTGQLNKGHPLSAITHEIRKAFGVGADILPMSDNPVRTVVLTANDELAFQDYFVKQGFQPEVRGFQFQGAERSIPAPGVLERLDQADLAIVCPSNPFVSIDPILSVPGIEQALKSRPTLAVSPIVGGEAIKGPAAKMFRELGGHPSALEVARKYQHFLKGFVLDSQDRAQANHIQKLGMRTLVTDIIMSTPEKRIELAREVLAFGGELEARQ